jgi:hypothetical protein
MATDSVEGIAVEDGKVAGKQGFGLTLDWSAVLLAFVLALLVRMGLLQHISW